MCDKCLNKGIHFHDRHHDSEDENNEYGYKVSPHHIEIENFYKYFKD